MASQGTFTLADIGGYTSFLTGVRIEHGKEIFKPRFPVISLITTPIFIRLMSSDIRKDMASLKELCETGKLAARESTPKAK